MSAAVYTVELDGKIIARRESLLWVRLDAPGLYVVCTEAEGEGVIVDGEIYHVRGCPIMPGKQTVTISPPRTSSGITTLRGNGVRARGWATT